MGTDDTSTTETSVADTGTDDESTGTADACVGLSREECNTDPACRPIACRPFTPTEGGQVMFCIGEPEYLGCQSADIGCDDARTVACIGDDAPVYVCPDTCIPPEAIECEPPVRGDVPQCP